MVIVTGLVSRSAQNIRNVVVAQWRILSEGVQAVTSKPDQRRGSGAGASEPQ